jgi:hypothetical protein
LLDDVKGQHWKDYFVALGGYSDVVALPALFNTLTGKQLLESQVVFKRRWYLHLLFRHWATCGVMIESYDAPRWYCYQCKKCHSPDEPTAWKLRRWQIEELDYDLFDEKFQETALLPIKLTYSMEPLLWDPAKRRILEGHQHLEPKVVAVTDADDPQGKDLWVARFVGYY